MGKLRTRATILAESGMCVASLDAELHLPGRLETSSIRGRPELSLHRHGTAMD